jgi:hypothetical protein
MPSKFITPPLGIWGLSNTGVGEQLLLECVNNDDTLLTLQQGDIVVPDRTAAGFLAVGTQQNQYTGTVKTIPNSKDPSCLGPVTMGDSTTNVQTIIGIGQVCMVAVGGVARVQTTGGAFVFGDMCQTSSTRKRALRLASDGAALADIGTVFAIELEAQGAADSAGTTRCLIARA